MINDLTMILREIVISNFRIHIYFIKKETKAIERMYQQIINNDFIYVFVNVYFTCYNIANTYFHRKCVSTRMLQFLYIRQYI